MMRSSDGAGIAWIARVGSKPRASIFRHQVKRALLACVGILSTGAARFPVDAIASGSRIRRLAYHITYTVHIDCIVSYIAPFISRRPSTPRPVHAIPHTPTIPPLTHHARALRSRAHAHSHAHAPLRPLIVFHARTTHTHDQLRSPPVATTAARSKQTSGYAEQPIKLKKILYEDKVREMAQQHEATSSAGGRDAHVGDAIRQLNDLDLSETNLASPSSTLRSRQKPSNPKPKPTEADLMRVAGKLDMRIPPEVRHLYLDALVSIHDAAEVTMEEEGKLARSDPSS